MSEQQPSGAQTPGGSHRRRWWKAAAARSLARLLKPGGRREGTPAHVDEHGRRRGLPPDVEDFSSEELRADANALASALGAPDPDFARVAAVERLTELRAAGALSEKDYKRERRRLMGEG